MFYLIKTFLQAFVLFHVAFKLLGVNAFQKLALVHNLASTVRKAMYHHFEAITKVMTEMMMMVTTKISGAGSRGRTLPMWGAVYIG